MSYDPFQNYPTLGPYYGITNPISLPYATLQNSPWNPMAAQNPLASGLGIPSIASNGGMTQAGQLHPSLAGQGGIAPQQLQMASSLASQAGIPQLLGLSPFAAALHNPQLANAFYNPMIAAGLQNPLLNPILMASLSAGPQLGYQPYPLYGQGGSPFGQLGSYPLSSYSGQQPGSPFGQLGQFFGQGGSPFAQIGQPYGQQIGFPLAPQTWVGQPGLFGGGQGFGQINNPQLPQPGFRPFQVPGISPWG